MEDLPSDDDLSDLESSEDYDDEIDHLADNALPVRDNEINDDIQTVPDNQLEENSDEMNDISGVGEVSAEGDLTKGDTGDNNTTDSGTASVDANEPSTAADVFDDQANGGSGKSSGKAKSSDEIYKWKKSQMAYKPSTFSSHEGPVPAYFGDCHPE